jgi:hypothetical protein
LMAAALSHSMAICANWLRTPIIHLWRIISLFFKFQQIIV